MKLKSNRVMYVLIKVFFKVWLMKPEKRELYIQMLRTNTDLDKDFTFSQKEGFHDYIDTIEEFLKNIN